MTAQVLEAIRTDSNVALHAYKANYLTTDPPFPHLLKEHNNT